MGPALIILFAVLWAAGWIVAARIRRPAALPGTVNPAHASVVVPARDEERNLPRLLDSLSRQSARPLEIIVVAVTIPMILLVWPL